jgi:hypothetical protein
VRTGSTSVTTWPHGANREGIAEASIKGQWLFERGKRGAILIMHSPRQIYIPPKVVLEPLYKVDKLIDKYLVTNIHVCSAYSMYLSEKCTRAVLLPRAVRIANRARRYSGRQGLSRACVTNAGHHCWRR